VLRPSSSFATAAVSASSTRVILTRWGLSPNAAASPKNGDGPLRGLSP